MIKELEAAVNSGAITFGMTMVHEATYCLARLGNSLARVQVLCPDGSNAFCFLIDSGEKMNVPLSDLTLLPCKNNDLAPQVTCSLPIIDLMIY